MLTGCLETMSRGFSYRYLLLTIAVWQIATFSVVSTISHRRAKRPLPRPGPSAVPTARQEAKTSISTPALALKTPMSFEQMMEVSIETDDASQIWPKMQSPTDTSLHTSLFEESISNETRPLASASPAPSSFTCPTEDGCDIASLTHLKSDPEPLQLEQQMDVPLEVFLQDHVAHALGTCAQNGHHPLAPSRQCNARWIERDVPTDHHVFDAAVQHVADRAISADEQADDIPYKVPLLPPFVSPPTVSPSSRQAALSPAEREEQATQVAFVQSQSMIMACLGLTPIATDQPYQLLPCANAIASMVPADLIWRQSALQYLFLKLRMQNVYKGVESSETHDMDAIAVSPFAELFSLHAFAGDMDIYMQKVYQYYLRRDLSVLPYVNTEHAETGYLPAHHHAKVRLYAVLLAAYGAWTELLDAVPPREAYGCGSMLYAVMGGMSAPALLQKHAASCAALLQPYPRTEALAQQIRDAVYHAIDSTDFIALKTILSHRKIVMVVHPLFAELRMYLDVRQRMVKQFVLRYVTAAVSEHVAAMPWNSKRQSTRRELLQLTRMQALIQQAASAKQIIS